MTGNALVLHVEPGAAREVAEQLSPYLSKVLRRPVTATTSVAATLRKQTRDAVLCQL